jgi:hypothetical protein
MAEVEESGVMMCVCYDYGYYCYLFVVWRVCVRETSAIGESGIRCVRCAVGKVEYG